MWRVVAMGAMRHDDMAFPTEGEARAAALDWVSRVDSQSPYPRLYVLVVDPDGIVRWEFPGPASRATFPARIVRQGMAWYVRIPYSVVMTLGLRAGSEVFATVDSPALPSDRVGAPVPPERAMAVWGSDSPRLLSSVRPGTPPADGMGPAPSEDSPPLPAPPWLGGECRFGGYIDGPLGPSGSRALPEQAPDPSWHTATNRAYRRRLARDLKDIAKEREDDADGC